MAMSVVYATVNGQLVEENRGGTITTYVSDTLGSVIQTRNSAGAQTSSVEFWPFGEQRAKSGTNPSPWGYCGTWGYYRDDLDRYYVRRRVLRVDLARWLTVDPLWPEESAYTYVRNLPVRGYDPFGLACQDTRHNHCSQDGTLQGACIALLCSLGAVKDMIDDLKAGIGIPEDKLGDLLKWLKGMVGKEYSPDECCKQAHGRPKGPGGKLVIDWPPIKYDPPDFAWIVQQICKRIGDSKSYCFIVCRSTSKQDCIDKCSQLKTDSVRAKCLTACEFGDWGSTPPENEMCQCGAKRGT